MRRNPWIVGLPVVLPMYVEAGKIALHRTPAWELALWAAWTIPIFLSMGYDMASSRPWVRPVRVRADARGLTIGERFVPRATIRRGVILPGEHAQVRLDLRGFRLPVQLRLGNPRDASMLLQVLGLDEAHTVAAFHAAPGVLVDQRLNLLIMALFVGWYLLRFTFTKAMLPFGVPGVFLLLWASRLIRRPTRVGVGADGVRLDWLWRRRFFGFDTISSVGRTEEILDGRKAGLQLVQASGEEIFVLFPDEGELSRAHTRIREAMDRFREWGTTAGGPYRESTGQARSAPFLRRGGRSLAEWAAALRALAAEAREGTAGASRARLLRIVEDPAAEAADRVAAAVVLGGDIDEERRTRLRAAVAVVAAPRLRVALEKAAESESDAESEAALAELEANEATVRSVHP